MWTDMGWRKRLVLVVLVVGALAVASYLTTGIYWDGGFPSGQIRILVVDESGTPLPGVSLRVLNPKTGDPVGDYPLQENTRPGGMVSGADGVITCHQAREGLQFGGFGWYLFWIIPLGCNEGPDFRFEFAKDGFGTRVLNADEFFEFGGQSYDAVPKITTRTASGDETEWPVWSRKVVLKRARK